MEINKDQEKALKTFIELASQPGFGLGHIFGGRPLADKQQNQYERLGDGYELRPMEILAEGGQFVLDNREKYSHLYHNGLKVSDIVFRKGGLGGDFRDGYCSLIAYLQIGQHTEKKHGFDSGRHVIINKLGEICLSAGTSLDHPSHRGGHLGKLGDTYYDLRTGQAVITCGGSSTIDGDRYLFVEHRYSWYNKELELGIYRIDKIECTYEMIDKMRGH
jgi:hypothetical protein